MLGCIGATAPVTTVTGTSMAYAITDAAAESRKTVQYFEMHGHRGIYHEGWKAVTKHDPGTPFDDDRWELYHVAEDRSECRDLAAEMPEKLAEMIDIWWREAEEHGVLPLDDRDPAFEALHKEIRERAAELGDKRGLPEEVVHQVLDSVTEPGRFADLVAGYLELPVPEKQGLLETLSVEERLRRVLVQVQRQISLLEAQEEIKSQVQEELGERQREMFLREQMKAIQKELGDDDQAKEIEELREKLSKLELPKEARQEVERELGRLERSGRESMEAQVIRTYLEWIAELPWNKRSDDQLDLPHAIRVLDDDHYGLKDVKDRVLEFLAVRQLRAHQFSEEIKATGEFPVAKLKDKKEDATPSLKSGEDGDRAIKDEKEAKARAMAKGPILLFVGPPGVGKTSIAKSIARSLGREYVRVALGGARDEADIRGHRRPYVGAMPGRIIQGMKQAGTKNPVFLLDEVDKLGVSFQGDPSSALLEVLDPAQNDTFTDHYLGVPFDLSEVLFIATANFIQNIPGPLLDRMEVVDFAGYTEREKAEIAKKYLIPRQLEENGLGGKPLTFSDEAIASLVSKYTRESGVRQLEREIGAVARKVARRIAANAPLAIRSMKRLFREGLTEEFRPHSAKVLAETMRLFGTADFREGITAFVEKRAPEYRGR